jgi:hypothetical protein
MTLQRIVPLVFLVSLTFRAGLLTNRAAMLDTLKRVGVLLRALDARHRANVHPVGDFDDNDSIHRATPVAGRRQREHSAEPANRLVHIPVAPAPAWCAAVGVASGSRADDTFKSPAVQAGIAAYLILQFAVGIGEGLAVLGRPALLMIYKVGDFA